MKKELSLEDELYRIGIWFLIIGVSGIFVYFKFVLPNVEVPSCVLYSILGVYCPGCGGTRAVRALCHGEILKSVWYHPIVLYSAVLFGAFMLTHTLEKIGVARVKGLRFHNWYLYGAIVILVVNVVLKNVLKFCFGITM